MVNKTHVANATDRDIFAMTDVDRTVVTGKLDEISAGIKDIGNIDAKQEQQQQIVHVAESRGFTKIRPNLYLPFEPHQEGTVFISIVCAGDDGNLKIICNAFPQEQNHSVIVGNDFQVYATKMGETWIDDNGRDFTPK